MEKFLDEKDFIALLKPGATISGEFHVERKNYSLLMDLDFEQITFKDFKLFGGDLASGIFHQCVFDNASFKNVAFVAVSFDRCKFIKCRLSNTQPDFGMRNCQIEELVIINEAE